jgi:hypothetical protein
MDSIGKARQTATIERRTFMTKSKIILLAGLIAIATPALAHDEGHGPKLTDTGKYGGVITAVVESKDAALGTKAPLVYKAELTRSEDGTVRVYLYDAAMKPLPVESLEKTAKATVIAVKGGKEVTAPFALTLEGNSFVGKAPAPAAKPFNIDVILKGGGKELLAAFDNLD